ncbi:MAG: hypothetical protein KJ607_14225 [Bacteroidetes bacterium]|nr:hypothetical protein [Bacteroidota bacterium]
MKKALGLLLIAGFIFALASCKKEYTCCYYDANGVEMSVGGAGCATATMSKSEMEDLESSMNTAAQAFNGTADCK